jgi:hypothetical protein
LFVFWLISLYWSVGCLFVLGDKLFGVSLQGGVVDISWNNGATRNPHLGTVLKKRWFVEKIPYPYEGYGLRLPDYSTVEFPPGTTLMVSTSLPVWVPFAICIAIASLSYWRQRCNVDPRYCRRCCYDLSHLESNRCPECGTVIAEGQKKVLVVKRN